MRCGGGRGGGAPVPAGGLGRVGRGNAAAVAAPRRHGDTLQGARRVAQRAGRGLHRLPILGDGAPSTIRAGNVHVEENFAPAALVSDLRADVAALSAAADGHRRVPRRTRTLPSRPAMVSNSDATTQGCSLNIDNVYLILTRNIEIQLLTIRFLYIKLTIK